MPESRASIADLRKSYERAELDEDASHADPLQQFGQWLGEAFAAQLPEPNAMTLATVASNLRPSTRIVLIKGFDARGIIWYTNYASRKGAELAGNPYAAVQFHWVELERVVRIEGLVEKVSDEESDAYFASRPLDSRIGAWASPQSEVISGRGVLLANAARYSAKFMLQPPRPPHWGGYRLRPDLFGDANTKNTALIRSSRRGASLQPPMPPASHSPGGGSVQQGLSAAYESIAFCKHRRAADKRYSLISSRLK